MKNNNNNFRHESFQDRNTIVDLISSLQQGLSKGQLTFSDEDNTISLEPTGLLYLTIEASAEAELNVLDVRITWQDNRSERLNKPFSVSTDESSA